MEYQDSRINKRWWFPLGEEMNQSENGQYLAEVKERV